MSDPGSTNPMFYAGKIANPSMKPQLTIQDFAGAHNANPDATRARLMRGGSYKKQRVILIIPAIEPIAPKVYLSHCNLGFPPNNGVVRILAEGFEVGDAYSQAIANILAHPELSKWEFVLTIEADNLPPADGVIRLIEDLEEHQELSAVGGLYYTKGPGGVAQIWGQTSDPVLNFRPQIPQPETIQECCGLGNGFTLFRLSALADPRLRKPLFKTLKGGEGYATQDLSAWSELRKYGYRCAVDTRVRVGHYDHTGKFGEADMVW